jgi:hypothetical protein
MKKTITRFLTGLLISSIVIALLVAAVIYFSVDTRIETETSIPDFRNDQTILRLDSSTVDPDRITFFVDSLIAMVSCFSDILE